MLSPSENPGTQIHGSVRQDELSKKKTKQKKNKVSRRSDLKGHCDREFAVFGSIPC